MERDRILMCPDSGSSFQVGQRVVNYTFGMVQVIPLEPSQRTADSMESRGLSLIELRTVRTAIIVDAIVKLYELPELTSDCVTFTDGQTPLDWRLTDFRTSNVLSLRGFTSRC